MHPLLATQQAEAARVLPSDVLRFFAGGADDELTLGEAERAWQQLRILPRVLADVGAVDTRTTLYGQDLATPVLVGPTAAHRLAHPEAEHATAQGAARAGSVVVLSARATVPDFRAVAGPFWHQAYTLVDRSRTWQAAEQAAEAGASAVVLTGDAPWLGNRGGATRVELTGLEEPGSALDPSATFALVGELAARTGLPVLVKGVLHPDDATLALEAGAAGIVVSNHGGRQLDRVVSTAAALPGVVAAVDGRVPVLVDGGLRSGLDVLCALLLGADAVLLGRPVLWALAAGGADGVAACLQALTADLAHCMGLAGATRLPVEGPGLIGVHL